MMSKGVKARAKDTREAHHRPSTSRQLRKARVRVGDRQPREGGSRETRGERERTRDVADNEDPLVSGLGVGLVDGLWVGVVSRGVVEGEAGKRFNSPCGTREPLRWELVSVSVPEELGERDKLLWVLCLLEGGGWW